MAKVGDTVFWVSELTMRDLRVGTRVELDGKAREVTYVETKGNWVTAGVKLTNAHGTEYEGHIKATKNKPVKVVNGGVVGEVIPLHPLDGEGNLVSVETARGHMEGVGPMFIINTLVHEDRLVKVVAA